MSNTLVSGRLSADYIFKQIRFYNVAAKAATQESVLKAVGKATALLPLDVDNRQLTPEERDRVRKYLELFLESQKIKVHLKAYKGG